MLISSRKSLFLRLSSFPEQRLSVRCGIPHFTDEAQRGEVSCPKTQSNVLAEERLISRKKRTQKSNRFGEF